MLRFDDTPARAFLQDETLDTIRDRIGGAHRTLLDRSGPGSDFLGWRDLLLRPNDALLEDLQATAAEIRRRADVFLCIGIGGSYLGARAAIEALSPYFHPKGSVRLPSGSSQEDLFGGGTGPEIIFAGHHMSGAYLRELLAYLEGKSVYVNVISKSGTTLEPALAFRLVRQWLEARFDDADRRIVVTTDPSSGALNQMQRDRGYKKYEIPRDVGGRFSVLTPVGLLPIAVAGIDIRSLFYGAVSACERFAAAADNPALDYAGLRYLLLRQGYAVELLAVFEPRLSGIGQWWQQLCGESEGKQRTDPQSGETAGTGLFPATVLYSTDLHSLGQYVQEGQRILIETFLMVDQDGGDLPIPPADGNLDGLDYLVGKTMREVNRKAYEGTARAHTDGGVPVSTIWLDRINAETLGELLYFFEHTVAVTGYLLGINPFDQPGVEAYKKEMFRLLGRPGSR